MTDIDSSPSSAPEIELLYQEFGDWLLAYARMIDGVRAEDLVQDAFASIAHRLRRPPPVQNPRGYLVRCVQNAATKDRKTPLSLFRLFRSDTHYDRYADPDLARHIGQLPPQQRSCIALRYGHDLTIPAIAELLELHPSTVKTHLTRGLESLRRDLGHSA